MSCRYSALIVLICWIGCQEGPLQFDKDEFILQDGFEIDLVASEPLLDSPVAMTFGHDGSLWVVELPGYMRDIEGADEDKPDGKIVKLLDNDGDGVIDKRTVIKDSLVAPRALALVYNGLLYTEGSNLWWESLDTADPDRELVDSLYVNGGNIEHQPNGLLYNIDNWIYSAKSNVRYRKIDNSWHKEATTVRGQWGISHDHMGRLFYNNNSEPLLGDLAIPNVLSSNSYLNIGYTLDQSITTDRRIYPYQATSVNRGYLDGVLDEKGKVKEFTSACGPLIYTGQSFGKDYKGNAFVCGPEANLIKRYILSESEAIISATQAYEGEEFLVSKDESFRPVNLYNGLDDAIYIVDMRKGIIQHRAFMTSYLRNLILEKGLDKISGKGRIYRIKKKDAEFLKTINDHSIDHVIKWLQSDVGSQRIYAQQQLIFSKSKDFQNQIQEIAKDMSNPLGQIHALYTLEGLGQLNQEMLVSLSTMKELDPLVRYHILQLALTENIALLLSTVPLDRPGYLELLICHYSGKVKDLALWKSLAQKHRNNNVFAEALISSVDTSIMKDMMAILNDQAQDTIYQVLSATIKNMDNRDWQAPTIEASSIKDVRTAGLNLYDQFCSSCHGLDGSGRDKLAPPIMQSEYVNDIPEKLILVLLHGLRGPIHVNDRVYDMNAVMPGLKDNTALTDEDIRDIAIFVRNSFSLANPWISLDLVTSLREKTKDRNTVFTEDELNKWLEDNVRK